MWQEEHWDLRGDFLFFTRVVAAAASRSSVPTAPPLLQEALVSFSAAFRERAVVASTWSGEVRCLTSSGGGGGSLSSSPSQPGLVTTNNWAPMLNTAVCQMGQLPTSANKPDGILYRPTSSSREWTGPAGSTRLQSLFSSFLHFASVFLLIFLH